MAGSRQAAAEDGSGLNLLPGIAATGVFHPHTATLDNGLQVVVVENHRAPGVAHWATSGRSVLNS